MTAAELAQAFRDAGDEATAGCMHTLLYYSHGAFDTAKSETAALAIAEARVREMFWAQDASDCYSDRKRGGLVCFGANRGKVELCWTGYQPLADCLHAALQAALEAPDGE